MKHTIPNHKPMNDLQSTKAANRAFESEQQEALKQVIATIVEAIPLEGHQEGAAFNRAYNGFVHRILMALFLTPHKSVEISENTPFSDCCTYAERYKEVVGGDWPDGLQFHIYIKANGIIDIDTSTTGIL